MPITRVKAAATHRKRLLAAGTDEMGVSARTVAVLE
jgi:hypothetical protein